MARKTKMVIHTNKNRHRKTRQGSSHNTKLRPGQKRYRGQGR